jgi:hypothetical protein
VDEDATRSSLDDELTDGYARALTIEADCVSTLREIAAATAARPRAKPTVDVERLVTRLGSLQAELAELRAELDERRRAVDPWGRLY